MNRLVALCLASSLGLGWAFLPTALAQRALPRGIGSITVTATGTAYGEPDEASFDAGVSVLNADVQAATAEVGERVAGVLNALQAAGVAAQDVRTNSFSVYPEQSYDTNGQPSELRYRVTNSVHVTVRDTAQLGEMLGVSVATGANEVSNVVYGFSDQRILERKARAQAMSRAREKAAQLARLGGAELGSVRRILEGAQAAGEMPSEVFRMQGMAADAAAPSVPVSSGQLAVTVALEVVYSLE